MNKKKEYYIELFLKKSRYDIVIKNAINYRTKIMYNEYKDNENIDIEQIQKQTYDIYIKEITELLDKKFNIEEIQKLIDFFCSEVGQKLSSKEMSHEFDKIMEKTMLKVDNLIYEGNNNETN
ncbi:MAG: DUF2059 domain-containing protein [archaeon]